MIASLEWQSSWWPWAAGAGALFLVTWLRVRPREWASVARAALRGVFVALLGLAYCEPQWVESRARVSKRRVLFVVDRSESMETRDQARHSSRAQQVERALSSLLKSKAMDAHEALELWVLPFGRVPSEPIAPLAQSRSPQDDRDRKGSNLSLALDVARGWSADPEDTVVLVSDGAYTEGGDPTATWPARGTGRGGGLWVVGVGSENLPPGSCDTRVSPLESLAPGIAGRPYRLKASVRHEGACGEDLDFECRLDGQVVARARSRAPVQADHEVGFEFTAPARGRFLLEVIATAHTGEIAPADNRALGLLTVVDDAARVLVVERRLDPALKHRRRAWSRLGEIALQTHEALGADEVISVEALLEGADAPRALVLVNVPSSWFSPRALDLVTMFVQRRGGGLLIIAGPDTVAAPGYTNPVWESLLPATIGGAGGFLGEAADVRPGDGALASSLMAPLDAEGQTDGNAATMAWAALPPLAGVYPVDRLLPRGEVLLRTSGQKPVLVAAASGRGRALVHLGEGDWRWSLAGSAGRERYRAFWQRVLLYTAGLPLDLRPRLLVSADPDRLALGESLCLVVEQQPLVDTFWPRALPVTVTRRDATSDPKTLFALPSAQRGQWRGDYRPGETGIFTAKLSEAPQAAPEREEERLDALFLVTEDQREAQARRARPELLRRLAEQAGARVLALEALPGALNDVLAAARAHPSMLPRRRPLAPSAGLLGALVTVLALAWFLQARRR